MHRILLVDDEAREQRAIATFLKNRGFEVLTASNCKAAVNQFDHFPDVIVTDLKMVGGDGLQVLEAAREELPDTPVILVTGHGTVASAVEAMKEGAFDYLTKPVDPEELLMAIERATERSQLQREVRRLRQQLKERGGLFGMVGSSEPMCRIFEQIQLVAPTRSTVLITGESGTGKELVAHAIHQLSPRKDRSFVALNCAAVPKELAESEMFGHVKGAFTGAIDKRIGKFMAANRGTLLVDEIGEMELPIQAKLLRTLESRTITPIGSNDEQPVDVRVVAATHRNLRSLVDEGKFREDLFYRLHVVQIELPPLRQRREDIPLLVATFLQSLDQEHGRNVLEVSFDAMDALRSYHWPGNVRELRNTLEGIVVLSRNEIIELADLPPHIRGSKLQETTPRFRLGTTLADMERDAIQQTLLQTGGSRQRTAKLLGISTRTLLRKIYDYGLEDPLHSDDGTKRASRQPT